MANAGPAALQIPLLQQPGITPMGVTRSNQGQAWLPPNPALPQAFGTSVENPTMGASDANLPPGLTLPPGWEITPLMPTALHYIPPSEIPRPGLSSEIFSQRSASAPPPTEPASSVPSTSAAGLPPIPGTMPSGGAPSQPTPTPTMPLNTHPGANGAHTQEQPPIAAPRPRTASIVPNESTLTGNTERTSRVSQESADSSADTFNLPNWGFSSPTPRPQAPNGANNGTEDREKSAPHTEANGPANGKIDKGKGKAVTVEDGDELD